MKKIFYHLMMAVIWLAGGVFFFFLCIYIAVSFLTKGFRKLFKQKGLYHFRENEFSALNVMHDDEKNISIGKLPTSRGEIFSYRVPLAAKEVLLEFKFTAYPADECLEFDYSLSSNDTTRKKEFIYIFLNPFDSLQVDYDKVLVWYPLPEDRVLKVEFTDAKPVTGTSNKIEGYLNVIRFR